MAVTDTTQASVNGGGHLVAPLGQHKPKPVEEEKGKTSPSVPPEIACVKHPLQHPWTLWYYRNDRTKSWQENLREVVTFATVEDFWAVFNHIESASRLGPGSDYSVFKAGIKPMWEDEKNANGGRWLLNLVNDWLNLVPW
jgi:translation initiation factor 4E